MEVVIFLNMRNAVKCWVAMSLVLLLMGTISCHTKNTEVTNRMVAFPDLTKPAFHCLEAYDGDWESCACPAQFELADSNQLTHLKNEFYRSDNGHLYERTEGLQEIQGKLTAVEYFNGVIAQELDPFTFEQLDGWYAKDRNRVFYCRPVSGGMLISRLAEADVTSFKLIENEYEFAMDKDHVFDNASVIEGLNSQTLKLKKNSKGTIIELVSGNRHYLVNE